MSAAATFPTSVTPRNIEKTSKFLGNTIHIGSNNIRNNISSNSNSSSSSSSSSSKNNNIRNNISSNSNSSSSSSSNKIMIKTANCSIYNSYSNNWIVWSYSVRNSMDHATAAAAAAETTSALASAATAAWCSWSSSLVYLTTKYLLTLNSYRN